MENQEVTTMIEIDLGAAFDTVDHDILVRLSVLNKQNSVSGNALNWLDSYLRPRSCKVSINSTLSTARALECKVSQGNCLEPWLYLTYAGTLFHVMPPSISLYGFADDHIAHKRFHPSKPPVETQSIKDLEHCAVIINDWMNGNKLKTNERQKLSCLVVSRC